MTTLEDIRVGDIMLCPDGVERKIEQCNGIFAHVGDDRWFNKSDLRNPEFRVGDKVRVRGKEGTYGVIALEHAGVVVFDRPGTEWNTRYTRIYPRRLALVERAPVADDHAAHASAHEKLLRAMKEKKPDAPRYRTIAEYLLDPKTKTNTPRCTLCGHANPRHYASCEHHPEPKGTLISTLGWGQPAPIVVLAQNDEDVP